jgi:hypothetical protein
MSGDATRRGPADDGDTLDGDAASRALDVPPAVLLGWAQRFSFPADVGTPDAPRFRRSEIEALREALRQSHSVEGAVQAAQEWLSGGRSPS